MKFILDVLLCASFNILVPHYTYLMLNLTDGRLVLEHVEGSLHIPPLDADKNIQISNK